MNGVPLRRVNQAYVMATSTKVDISGVKISEEINDAYFNRAEEKTDKKKSAKDFLGEKKKGEKKPAEKKKIADKRVSDQKSLDSQIVPLIEKVPQLKEYLKSKFSLSNKQYPHEMKF